MGYYFFNGWKNFLNVSTVLLLHLLSCVATLSATFMMTLNISWALLPFLPGDRILKGVGSGVYKKKMKEHLKMRFWDLQPYKSAQHLNV